ncbi:MAG TPA: branched-chain amino acid ABC transporter permease [Acidimicrobiia bacterium]|nr:branched-chain amino acid ABC transporter permease [Acidimicrobiia bacterium]
MAGISTSRPAPARRFRFNWVDSFLWFIRVAAIIAIVVGLTGTIQAFMAGEGPSVQQWRDLFVSSISTGAMYGLVALGYSMVYGVLGFINFAHGEVFMSGIMVGWVAATLLFQNGLWEANPILSLCIVLIVSMFTSTLIAILTERIAYRRLRGAPRLIPLITSIGVSFFLQYAFAGLFGVGLQTYPTPPGWLGRDVNIFGVPVEGTEVLVITVSILAMVALWYFVAKTKTGRAMRAVAEDKEIAGLMGINVDRTIVTTFAVGGAMAGVGGLLWALLFRNVQFITGFLPGIKAFTAAVLGGIGNLPGAMLGGVVLGLFEGMGPLLVLGGLGIPAVSQLKDAVAFSALILVLIFRPSGLLGERLGSEDRA